MLYFVSISKCHPINWYPLAGTLVHVYIFYFLPFPPRHWQFLALGKIVAALDKSNAGDSRRRHWWISCRILGARCLAGGSFARGLGHRLATSNKPPTTTPPNGTEQNRTEQQPMPSQAKPSRRPLWLNNFYSRHQGALNREVCRGKGWSMGGWQDGPQDNPCEKWVVAALNASAMVSELTAQRHSHTLVGIWLLILHIYKNQTIYICDTYSSCMQLVAVGCESELAR